eukprot:gb/GEZN01006199.1/.p1 GENE.gb/GEZN01006199.1/~~gb/GEZN01006199.1/.p1  ORF type:complete len:391 (-),score=45.30 gb/GEZN01006199.1/:300-1472(-)
MGCCGSSSESSVKEIKRNAQVADRLKKDQADESKVFKLLLLGAGESGKSTLLKQMVQIYGDGFDKDEQRSPYVTVVWLNAIQSMQALCRATEDLPAMGYKECELTDPDLLKLKAEALDEKLSQSIMYEKDAQFPEKMANCYATLWKCAPVQAAYELRSKFQLNDSCKFFLDKIHKISARTYLPDKDDIMHTRIRTVGIQESAFYIKGCSYHFVDVGGQRSERRKWMHCFAGVTAMLYVVAMSAFDQTLFEDSKVNRIDESLSLFSSLTNSKWFKTTPIILFLNKEDLFRAKIKKTSLQVWRPEFEKWVPPNEIWSKELKKYTSPPAREELVFLKSKIFLERQFQKQNWDPQRTIHHYSTTATNTDNIAYVFESVRHTVFEKWIEEINLGA